MNLLKSKEMWIGLVVGIALYYAYQTYYVNAPEAPKESE